jgi:hypothetical protein
MHKHYYLFNTIRFCVEIIYINFIIPIFYNTIISSNMIYSDTENVNYIFIFFYSILLA